MTHTTTDSRVVSLSDDRIVEVTFKEYESTQKLNHFGSPCELADIDIEILTVIDLETGDEVGGFDSEILELI